MSTNFPTSLDSFPSAATLLGHTLGTDPHSTLHGNLGDSVLACETAIGITGSADTNSLEYRLTHLLTGSTVNVGATATACTIQQVAPASGAGNDITLKASAAASGNTNGGNVVLLPGAKSGSGTNGAIVIQDPSNIGTYECYIYEAGNFAVFSTKGGVNTIAFVLGYGIGGESSVCSLMINANNTNIEVPNNYGFAWSSGSNPKTAGPDTCVARTAAGVVEITAGQNGSAGKTLRSKPLSPTTLSADQNDYNPGVARRYRLATNGGGARNITGMSISQVDGQEFSIVNVSASDTITLKHQSASSTAANRFICTGAADIVLATDEEALVWYDATTSRFRVRKV